MSFDLGSSCGSGFGAGLTVVLEELPEFEVLFDGLATVTLVPPMVTLPASFGFAGSLTSVASITVIVIEALPTPPAVAFAFV